MANIDRLALADPTARSAVPTSAPRRDDQRARTRRELLDAAASVFAQFGYHGTSVDQVAEAAGYTKGAVYSNFSSKQDLFLALLDEQVDAAVDVVEQVVAETAPQDRPQRVGQLQDEIAVLDQQWYLLETEFLLYAARNPDVRDRVAARQQRTRERVTALVAAHLQELGVEPEVPAEDLTMLLMAAADGLTQAALISDDVAARRGSLLGRLAELLLVAAAQQHRSSAG